MIEWAEKVKELLPDHALYMHLFYIDEEKRDLVLEGPEDRMKSIIEALENGGF